RPHLVCRVYGGDYRRPLQSMETGVHVRASDPAVRFRLRMFSSDLDLTPPGVAARVQGGIDGTWPLPCVRLRPHRQSQRRLSGMWDGEDVINSSGEDTYPSPLTPLPGGEGDRKQSTSAVHARGD